MMTAIFSPRQRYCLYEFGTYELPVLLLCDLVMFINDRYMIHYFVQWNRARAHTHPFNDPFSTTTDGTRNVKPIWISLKQEAVSGSGISWAVCKSAPRCRQITTLAPDYSVFTGRMPFLPANQQHQTTQGSGATAQIEAKTGFDKWIAL